MTLISCHLNLWSGKCWAGRVTHDATRAHAYTKVKTTVRRKHDARLESNLQCIKASYNLINGIPTDVLRDLHACLHLHMWIFIAIIASTANRGIKSTLHTYWWCDTNERVA